MIAGTRTKNLMFRNLIAYCSTQVLMRGRSAASKPFCNKWVQQLRLKPIAS